MSASSRRIYIPASVSLFVYDEAMTLSFSSGLTSKRSAMASPSMRAGASVSTPIRCMPVFTMSAMKLGRLRSHMACVKRSASDIITIPI